jgi:hypothetical protein
MVVGKVLKMFTFLTGGVSVGGWGGARMARIARRKKESMFVKKQMFLLHQLLESPSWQSRGHWQDLIEGGGVR